MEVWVVEWADDYCDCNVVSSSFERADQFVRSAAQRMSLTNFMLVEESTDKDNLWRIYEFNGRAGLEESTDVLSVAIVPYIIDNFVI